MNPYKEGDYFKDDEGTVAKLFGLEYTEMVYVATGSFMMHDKLDYEIDFTKGPLKDGFFMGKYPVTQELYAAVMGHNPSYFKGRYRPVENITWNEICQREESFLAKLNTWYMEKYGGEGIGFSLPSEAQWEYAAAGGSQSRPTQYAGSNHLEDVGWFRENSNKRTMPVGLKQGNLLGFHDMSGNVWEWCADDYVPSIQSLPEDGTPYKTASTSNKALRGGSCFNDRGICRLGSRNHHHPSDLLSHYCGFRLCFPHIPTEKN